MLAIHDNEILKTIDCSLLHGISVRRKFSFNEFSLFIHIQLVYRKMCLCDFVSTLNGDQELFPRPDGWWTAVPRKFPSHNNPCGSEAASLLLPFLQC